LVGGGREDLIESRIHISFHSLSGEMEKKRKIQNFQEWVGILWIFAEPLNTPSIYANSDVVVFPCAFSLYLELNGIYSCP